MCYNCLAVYPHGITITVAIVLLSVTETSGEGKAAFSGEFHSPKNRYAYGRWHFDQFNLIGSILYYLWDADCVRSTNEKRPL